MLLTNVCRLPNFCAQQCVDEGVGLCTRHNLHRRLVLTIVNDTKINKKKIECSSQQSKTEDEQEQNSCLHVLFSLPNSTTVICPPPPSSPYAMLIWEVLIGRKLFVTQKTTLSRGGGGGNMVVHLFTTERAL